MWFRNVNKYTYADDEENKSFYYRDEDGIEEFCNILKENATEILNFKQKD